MSNLPEFKQAGLFLRQARKAQGFKTQKALITALKARDPQISCSESYISLIEKGVKTPGVHLLDVMAEVLQLSAPEKGELLLTYKRVPSDFEFAVRDNLKAAAQLSRLDSSRERYAQSPTREHFDQLLQALVLEGQSTEALKLLKQSPTFENEILELQERTAKIASLSGNYDFARHAFELALDNCRHDTERAANLMHIGILYFQQGLQVQNQDLLRALDFYVQAMPYFEQSLQLNPEEFFNLDERTRCAYHLGDGLLQWLRMQPLAKPDSQQTPALSQALQDWFGRSPKAKAVEARAESFFQLALQGYQVVLAQAHHNPLPDKPMQEAVFFHAYVHGKLKLFSQARVLIHSNLLLEPNWLTWFMKAGLSLMEYEQVPAEHFLDEAEQALSRAMDFDLDAVKEQIQLEKERELRSLWTARPKQMEALLARHD